MPAGLDQKFDRRDVYIITQNALADGTYLNYIRAHYNRSTQIDPPFFQELFRPRKSALENYSTNLLARAVRRWTIFSPASGDRIEKRRRTFTSWFAENDFTDLPGFAAKLRPADQDPVSQVHLRKPEPEDPAIVDGQADDRSRARLWPKT